MGARGPSIIDIAQLAGVSKSTVSAVLNNKGRVSEQTRERVLAIAEREGYVASFAAKSLRETRTRTVGILTPDVSNEFFSAIVMRMERALYEAGYSSFVCDTESDPGRERAYIHSLMQRQVDGLAFVNSAIPLELSEISAAIPVIVIDRLTQGTHQHCVVVENNTRLMVHDMTQALTNRGRSRIVYLNVSSSPLRLQDTARYLGYLDAIAEAGVRLDHQLVLRGPHKMHSRSEARALIAGLIEQGIPFDGVVAMGDRVAIGAGDALADVGLSIGQDVLLMGCDDSSLAQIVQPSLSSVDRNIEDLAQQAVVALLTMMSGEEPAERIIIPHQVIERASTLGA